MRRVLSVKRLAILAGVVAVLVGGAVAAHAIQSRRQSSVLKTQAERAAAAAATDPERLDDAVRYYKQYLKYRKTDEEAFSRYAHLLTDRAKAEPKYTEPAVNALEEYLRQFPDHPDDRRTLIDLSMRLGRLTTARQHVGMLLDAPGGAFAENPDLLDKAAACELGLGGDFGTAIKYLDKAVRTRRAKPEVAARLLGLLNGNKGYSHPSHTPGEYVDILLTSEPYASDVAARVVAARYLLLKGELARAGDQIEHALAKMPGGATDPEARMAAAELELFKIKDAESVQPQLKKAEEHLRTAVTAAPADVGAGLMLSRVLADQGKRGEAIDVLKRSADALGETNDRYLLVVDRLLDLEELDLSGRLTEKIASNEADRDLVVKYLRARTAVVKGDLAAARPLLEEVAPKLTQIPDYHKKAMAGLGRCYEALQNPDKTLECYAEALKDDPRYLAAVVGEAEALLKLGRLRDALPRYRTLVGGYKLDLFRPKLARLELRAALAQSAPSRKWDEFELALGPVAARTPELDILYAESLLARSEREKAAGVLEAVLRKDSKNTAAWIGLARIRGTGSPDQLAGTLAEAEKAVGDSADLRLARAMALLTRGRRPGPDDFRASLAKSENLSLPEQNRLLKGVGELAARAGASAPEAEAGPLRALALDCFQKAAALDRGDLVARAVLVDLGMAMSRPEVVSEALAGLAAVEGENGPIGTLGRVVMRLPGVKAMTDPAARGAAVRELRGMASRAKAARPGWGRVYIALARLDEMEGLTDSALTNYQAALERGERDEFVIRRTVELLRDQKKDDLAAALLNGLHTEVPLPEDLERFRAVRDLLARDIPRAERPTIERIAPADHKDWRVLLLRGSLLAAIGEDEEALTAFQNAVFYGDNVPDAWGALVGQQIRLGRADAARTAITEAAARLTARPPAEAAKKAEMIDTLAACYELVGDAGPAEAKYREAVQAAPHELNPTRQLVLYLQRAGKGKEAGDMLNRLAGGAAGDAARWARRHLALTLMASPDAYAQRDTALRLVDQNLAATPPDQEDVKAKALVQTVDPRTRAEGVKALGEFARWGGLTPDEFYHLGKLHFDQGKVFEAVEFFEKATRGRAGLNAEHIAALARVYLGTNDLPRARQAVARLKAFAPQGWEAAREEARLLKREATEAEKKSNTEAAAAFAADAKKRVLDFPGATGDGFVRTKSGPLLEELGFYPEAEALYARLIADPKGHPFPHLPMAVFLINRKRTDEALRLAKEYEAKAPLEVTARLMTGAIRTKSPGPAAEREVAAWLDARYRATINPFEQLTLLGGQAELQDATGKYDEAITTYERAIDRAKGLSPEDLKRFPLDLFKNNLAMLLVLRNPGHADKAIAMMSDVIAVRGPAPVYLDTRAVAYLVKGGRVNEAVEDLRLALIQQHRPGYLFHLAWAYDLDPPRRTLRETPLAEARRLGLTADDLHPLEARKFAELFPKR